MHRSPSSMRHISSTDSTLILCGEAMAHKPSLSNTVMHAALGCHRRSPLADKGTGLPSLPHTTICTHQTHSLQQLAMWGRTQPI
jgi:hypothetical protein